MSSRLEITPLPYQADPLGYFAPLRKRRGAVLLDSGRPHGPGGRYDIISAEPIDLMSVNSAGRVSSDSGTPLPDEPIAAQKALLSRLDVEVPESELPFLGGLIGYWSYDFGRCLEPVNGNAREAVDLPWSRIGLYDWAIIQDHVREETYLVADQRRRAQVKSWLDADIPATAPFAITAPFAGELNREEYGERFRAVQRYIHAGDCYQINLTQRFSAPFRGDLWQAYLRLRQATPTPFAGFMAWDDKAVLSLSPERFLQCHGGRVEARPIKGTRPRGDTTEQDAALAQALKTSAKDRAENVMIVDLLRNDLGRACAPGSVKVPQLCGLESYSNVHHLVSVVEGRLADDQTPLDILAAAFPGGSITGAPKIRAMQIIDELEPSRRSVYCGSLGYIDQRGHMDTSIAIRTAVASGGQLHLWGGGGLVADSQEDAEYLETLDKIRHLLTALSDQAPQ